MLSITFAEPTFLWFLLAIPALIVAHFFMLRHAKRKAMKFANFMAIKRVTGERLITKNYTILIIRMLVIACAVLAVAQVTVWYDTKTNANQYVIAIDTSASMKAEDVMPSRLEAAKLYGERFIDQLEPHTGVGIVSFSGVTFIEEPLTIKREDLHDSMRAINVTASGTDIPGALITSVNLLTQEKRGRAIILLSDGSNTIEDFHSRSLQRSIAYANVHHVKIYTIGVGRDARTPIGYLPQYYNVSSRYNEDNLFLIANSTGGKYYYAADNASLALAYDDIRAGEIESRVPVDLVGPLMLACLILIMLEWVLINTRFRSLP